MPWKKLSKAAIDEICWIRETKPLKNCDVELLKKLVQHYGFVDYNHIDLGCSLMFALKNGNYRGLYNNPGNKSSFHKKYGYDNPKVFRNKLLDHGYAFRNEDKKMYIVASPYLSRDEIIEKLEMIPKVSIEYGDFSELKYDIIDKEESYYYPGETSTIVFYT